MLTTTFELSSQARLTRLMWPACRAPMVGTRPMVWPSWRHRREVSSIAPGVSKMAGALAGAVLDLFFRILRPRRNPVGRVGVLRTGERPLSDLLGVLLGRLADLLSQVGVTLHELGRLAGGEPEHVVKYEHLAIGSGAGADPDGRDSKSLCHPGGHGVGHTLEDDAEGARLLQVCGIGQDASRLRLSLALDLEAAHLVHKLRRQPQVPHDRDSELGQAPGDVDDVAAPLQLDRVHATLLQEAPG